MGPKSNHEKETTMTAVKTMETAMNELREAVAERAALSADMNVFNEQYAALGRKAQTTDQMVERQAVLQEQRRVLMTQAPVTTAMQKARERVEAAKAAVAKAAEREAEA